MSPAAPTALAAARLGGRLGAGAWPRAPQGGGKGTALVFLPGLHLGGPLWFHHERAVSPASLTNVASPLVCSSLTALEAPSVAARIQMRVQKGHFRWRSSRLCRTCRRSCSVRWCTGSQRGACLVLRKTGQRCHLGHRSRATSTRGAVLERADSRPPLVLPLKSISFSAGSPAIRSSSAAAANAATFFTMLAVHKVGLPAEAAGQGYASKGEHGCEGGSF